MAKIVGTTTMFYVYDGDGSTLSTSLKTGSLTAGQLIQEYRNSIYDLTINYCYGPRIDELICVRDLSQGEDIPAYYYHDGLGSVIAMADYMGNDFERYSYDVFGKMTLKKSVPGRKML